MKNEDTNGASNKQAIREPQLGAVRLAIIESMRYTNKLYSQKRILYWLCGVILVFFEGEKKNNT